MKIETMLDNGIWVPSGAIIDIYGAIFKDTDNLASYDIWYYAHESRIHMDVDIPEK